MTPENEQGVIVLFSQQAQAAGFEIVSIGTAFPDAVIVKDGAEYRAEFEYQAANFKSHKHDVRKCDIIIAWVNDWPDCVLPVLTLSEPSWADTDLALPGEWERQAAYWEQRALSAEARLKHQPKERPTDGNHRMSPGALDDQARLMLADDPGMGPRPLARALGVAPSTASGILERVRSNGKGG